MAKCAGCGKFLSPSGAATCTFCPCMFHKGCVAIPDFNAVPKDWVCPECKKKQRRGDNTSTPVKGIGEPSLPPVQDSQPEGILPLPLADNSPPVEDSDVRAMRRELSEYMAELREFRKEFRTSIEGMGKRMDGFERRLEAVELKEATSPAAEQVTELQRTVVQLRQELNEREQDTLLTDLDIGHLPEDKTENVQHTVILVAAKLGVNLEDRDIVFAERVGVSVSSGAGDSKVERRSRRVVVRLARRHLRDELLRAARVRRNLTTADIGLAGPPRRVYVNERLTRSNRQLFHRVREECRKKQWRYFWTKGGRIICA